MKFLIAIAVIAQLSLADKTFMVVVQPPNEKLYPIFDYIATKMQELHKIQYSWLARNANQILPEYEKFMLTRNKNDYKEFNEAFLQAFSTAQQFTEDPENCRLQRAAFTDVMTISELRPSMDDFKNFFQNLDKKQLLKIEEDKPAIRDISQRFPELIKDFLESLNEKEKYQYPELYRAGEEVLKAAGGRETFNAIKSFMQKAEYNKNLAEANDKNCKWDLTNFDEFVNSVLTRSDHFTTN